MADEPSSTPLPRAVIRMRDNVNKRVDEYRARQLQGKEGAPPPASSDPPPDGTPPAPPVAQPPVPPNPSQDPRHETVEFWRGRATGAEGILKRQTEELREARRQVAELTAQVEDLRRAQAQPPAPSPAAATPDVLAFFTPEEIERYGEEQCRKMMNVAITAARGEITTQLEKRVKPLETRVATDDQQRAQQARAAFNAELDRLLPPDWREIDRSPEWLAWLGEVDDRTGETRATTLQRLNARNDAPRCARIFLEYLESQGRPHATATPSAPLPPAAPVPAAPRPPVTPGGSGAGGSDGTPPARAERLTPPTQAEIRDFYKRASLGKVSDEERTLFERRRALLYPRGTAP